MANERSLIDFIPLSAGAGVPPWLSEKLRNPGVPKTFMEGIFEAADSARVMSPDHPNLVLIGYSPGYRGVFCVDLGTSALMLIQERGETTLVNSSLDHFCRCIQAVEALWEPELWIEPEDNHRAEDRMLLAIKAIDRAAICDVEGLWESFCADIGQGDYNLT
ncbi:SUKH-4 family immunity protein [Actinoplanes sp. NPDC048796]|uniref:SUKH-4 family immunity protein n=1 Tax=Actinoplanes sp. NPDC048796 TaxID=3155640 RepID=UPI0033E9816C